MEATKFTEVGYVGREVDSIIRELADSAVKMVREGEMEKVSEEASQAAEERILDVLLPAPKPTGWDDTETSTTVSNTTREKFREKLHSGSMDDKEIEIEVNTASVGVEIMATRS